jgi:hypothetical protein
LQWLFKKELYVPFHKGLKKRLTKGSQVIVFPVGTFVAFPGTEIDHFQVIEFPEGPVKALLLSMYGPFREAFDGFLKPGDIFGSFFQ